MFARLRERLTDDAARAAVGNRVLPQDPLTGEAAADAFRPSNVFNVRGAST